MARRKKEKKKNCRKFLWRNPCGGSEHRCGGGSQRNNKIKRNRGAPLAALIVTSILSRRRGARSTLSPTSKWVNTASRKRLSSDNGGKHMYHSLSLSPTSKWVSHAVQEAYDERVTARWLLTICTEGMGAFFLMQSIQ